jgi:hypothetical protein
VAFFLYSKNSVKSWNWGVGMFRWLLILFLAGTVLGQAAEPLAQGKGAAEQTPAGQVVQGRAPAAGASAAEPAPVPMKPEDFPLTRFKEFSAIAVGSLVPRDEKERHIYRSGDLMRAESGQGLGYLVTDLDKMETYGFARTGCMKDKHPFLADFPFTEGRPDRHYESVARNKETFDGHECQIEDVTMSGKGLLRPITMRFWEAEDLQGFPIKVQVIQGPHVTVHFRNVVIGPQDPTLFLRPNSCTGELPKLSEKPKMLPQPSTPKAKPQQDPPQ